jgi:hypothetical protein
MDTPISASDRWAPMVPARQVMAHIADQFPAPQRGSLRVFWKGEPTLDPLRRAAAARAANDGAISSGPPRGQRRGPSWEAHGRESTAVWSIAAPRTWEVHQ